MITQTLNETICWQLSSMAPQLQAGSTSDFSAAGEIFHVTPTLESNGLFNKTQMTPRLA